MSPNVEIVTVTPDMARAWLKFNTRNRNFKSASIKQYAADMRDGNWMLAGGTIVLSDTGTLLDGQNRLRACIEANKPFQTQVLTGVPDAAQDAADRGAKRTAGDVFTLHGFENANQFASTVAMDWRWDNGDLLSKYAPSIAQQRAHLDANPRIEEAFKMAHPLTRDPICVPPRVAGCFTHRALLLDTDAATTFVQDLLTGAELTAGDPVLVLRDLLTRRRLQRFKDAGGINALAVMIKAWNARVNGQTIRRLFWRSSTANGEAFPTMLGLDGKPVDWATVTRGQYDPIAEMFSRAS